MEKPTREMFQNDDDYLDSLENYVCDYVVSNISPNEVWAPELNDPEFDDFYFGPRIFDYEAFDESQNAPTLFQGNVLIFFVKICFVF